MRCGPTKRAALQLFLGGVGAGRFYTGHTGIAVAQLLVTILTLGIGAIWGFIDGIVLLAGNPRDPSGRPLRS
ncbi:MAG: TM2 domain-containing protein [Pseudonocardiales bacterium]|nr:TM2 domain-containing protein [Pseudonocardiales bacterium]